MSALPTRTATRYIVPLREGGSLPAILDTEEGGEYVTKFRGAGQGARALIAEIIVGELARVAGLPIPDLALVDLPDSFGRSEPDPEIQDILNGSRGTNVGMRYLPGAFNFDPLAVTEIDPDLAAEIVWLDAYVTNVDRTPRNTNLLYWEEKLWMIDHGAALYFHHNWDGLDETKVTTPFAPIRDHVLLPFASDILDADRRMTERIDVDLLASVIAMVPDELLMDAPRGTEPPFPNPSANRDGYRNFLTGRLRSPRAFVDEAERAREKAVAEKPVEQRYRR